jgi:hypothetical protein
MLHALLSGSAREKTTEVRTPDTGFIFAASSTVHLPATGLSSSLATSQPDGLPVLLQLGNKLVTLADDILVLLVLVVRAVGLDDTAACDTIDSAGNAAGGDELGQVAK